MEATVDSDVAETQQADMGDRWSLLPPELLQLIARRLRDTGDFARFRAVCTAWRAGAAAGDAPPQLPWVLERRACGLRPGRQLLRLYSHSAGRMYRVPVGGRSLLLARGACQGRVVATVDLSSTVLYNPFTREGQALPPPPHRPWPDGLFHVVDDGGGEGGCLVVNTCAETRQVAWCRPGVGAEWKRAAVGAAGQKDLRHSAYLGGRLFVNTAAAGETLVVDAATGAVEAVVPPPPRENLAGARHDYLVASRGKLLRAVQHPRDGSQQAESAADCRFNMYQLNLDYARGGGGGPKAAAWAKVETIGDAALFFDDHGHGFSLPANEAAGLTRGCVYFVHEKRTWVDIWEYRFLCRYSVADGRVDRAVPLPDTFGDTWVVPSLCRSDE